MVSFPPVSPARPYTTPSPHPYAPHTESLLQSSAVVVVTFPRKTYPYSERENKHIRPQYSFSSIKLYLWVQIHNSLFTQLKCTESAIKRSGNISFYVRRRELRIHGSAMKCVRKAICCVRTKHIFVGKI